tara:strand:+ start:690 stop:1181 length:492 start_codon:yes stop_codon:yes gene_type:complete
MIIHLKNKDTLIVDDFKFKCCIGKNGLKKLKIEGDKATPIGVFKINKLYYRADRVKKPNTSLKTKIIKKNMGWCNDPKNKLYNKEIKINKLIKHEKLFRKDNKYDYFMVINYNQTKPIPFKGSAIFLHLTKNYNATAGCIAIKKNDFLILAKLIKKEIKINIS